MAMAMPLSDMMFDVMPNCFIRMNEIRIETGSGNVTIRIAAEVKEENDVRERHENDLLRERVLQRLDGAVDQLAAVVEWLDCDARRKARA